MKPSNVLLDEQGDAILPEIDLDQPKLGSISLPLTQGYRIGQTFVALHLNLTGVEVYPALYAAASEAESPGRLILHLRTDPDSDWDLVTRELAGARLRTNQPARFSFPPLPDSQGKSYYLPGHHVGEGWTSKSRLRPGYVWA